MTALIMTAILLALGASIVPQQDLSDAKIEAERVAGNIHMFKLVGGAAGNIGVSAGPDGFLIVDDQFAPLADKIRAALKDIDTGELKFVLNTHWHGDHTHGNRVFGAEALIIAHSNVRKRLMTDQSLLGRVEAAAPPQAWPVVTFEESVSVHFNGEEIRVIHFPAAHTDGDSVIYFTGSNVVHMGDHYFKDRFPFVDIDSGGSVEGLRRAVAAVIKMMPEDVKVIPGHGDLATLDDLRRYHLMLKETIEMVRGLKESGRDESAARLPEKYESWGHGFIDAEAWIRTIFRSIE